jgi:hypothetical protein
MNNSVRLHTDDDIFFRFIARISLSFISSDNHVTSPPFRQKCQRKEVVKYNDLKKYKLLRICKSAEEYS